MGDAEHICNQWSALPEKKGELMTGGKVLREMGCKSISRRGGYNSNRKEHRIRLGRLVDFGGGKVEFLMHGGRGHQLHLQG